MSFYEFLHTKLLPSIEVLDIIQIILVLFVLRVAMIACLSLIKKYSAKFTLLQENQRVFRRFTRAMINIIGLLITLILLGFSISKILSYELLQAGQYSFKVFNIVNAVLIIFVAQMILWLTYRILDNFYKNQPDWDIGTRFAINQILKYVVYTLAILSSIQALGFHLTVIWGGAAALMVGFGLGLQHTFNDLVSGLLLLIERTVEVGDTLDIDGTIGIVQRIGLRVSHIRSRDNIMILVPNSKLVTSKVINWSHKDDITKFIIKIGVAYGTDTGLVKRLLLEVANKHEEIETYPSPFVRFVDFADSSLDFELHFWCKDLMKVEDVKSDLRFTLDEIFRKEKIEIPFPQREIWSK